MSEFKNENHKTGRREFLSKLSSATTIGLLGTASYGISSDTTGQNSPHDKTGSELPAISFGKYQISRLICGSNTINGNSYMGHHTDQIGRAHV
jgi:hypothetical protein